MLKNNDLMSALFGQMEMLQELAIKAGDLALSQDISAALARSLERYCDAKRSEFSVKLDAAKSAA